MNLTEIYPWSWGKIKNAYIEGDNIIADIKAEVEKYYPFNCEQINQENIFTDFISIRAEDNNSILTFIKKYGYLFNDISESKMIVNEKGESESYYESLSDFREELKKCKQIADLYVLIGKEDCNEEIINKIKALDPRLLLVYQTILREMVVQNIDLNIDIESINKNKFMAMLIIIDQVNNQIKSVHNKMIINEDTLEFEDSWESPNLLSMIYLMFSLRLVSKKLLRRCKNPYCENSFFIIKDDKRKLFCSHECASNYHSYIYKQNHRDEINEKKREKRKMKRK